MELEKQIVLLNDNLLAIENQPDIESEASAQRLASLMRSVHSIKGAARIVGLAPAVEMAHAMEDGFVAIKQGQIILTSSVVDVLLSGVDWFTQLGKVADDTQADWFVQQEAETQRCLSAIAALLTTAPPADASGQPPTQSPIEPTVASTIIKPLAEPLAELPVEPLVKSPVESLPEPLAESSPEIPTSPSPMAASQVAVSPRNSLNGALEKTLEKALKNGVDTNLNNSLNGQAQHVTVQDHGVGLTTDDDVSIPADSKSDQVVRVNASNLDQLMALAGESLVEVNWLEPFADTMQHLKQRQQTLTSLLEAFQQSVSLSPADKKKLEQVKRTAIDCHGLLSDRIGDFDQFSRRFSQLSDNLYREVIASHMRPFSDSTQGFPRMVRDLAKEQGKQVRLEIIGQSTQIDRTILDKLEAPLTHMLRNAIAHGIESVEQRQQLGKPSQGTIRLEATHRAGMLSITVSDDGSGINVEQLRHSIVEKQLTPPALAAQLNEAELLEFLFLPGFSTAPTVTQLSGRGVGLDIAKSMVQEVGGLLRAVNKPGAGLSFHFQLPLTLSVIRALVVDISGEAYAFGLTRIDQVRLIKPSEISISENRPYIVVDNENISLVQAQQVLELPETSTEDKPLLSVVILSDQTHRYGIIVDSFLGEREVVVRPLDERFGKVQDVSAAALTKEGVPLLIIDVADLVRSIEQLVTGGNLTLLGDAADLSSSQRAGQRSGQKSGQRSSHTKGRVLVVEDSMTVREMERQLLQNHGYDVDVAVNGMEGWNTVRSGDYDLVVSDVDMPRMNGIELVQHIKEHPQLKQLPVIIVSYKDRQADQLAGLNAGADYYLTKSSFQDNSLLKAVMDLIG